MPVNTTFRHPLFAQIIKYSNIRYGRNISGTDCIPEKNERLVLTGCITANQYGRNLFMDRLFQWFSVEVFINDGEQVMSAVILTKQEAKGISFFADGAAKLDIVKYDLL